MTIEATTTQRLTCPACEKMGKRVSAVTLAELLGDDCAEQFKTDSRSCCDDPGGGCKSASGNTGWRFCESQSCDVVYFSEQGDTTFTKSRLKVSVGVKETTGERPLCYCFQHSVASIKEELRVKGRSDALEVIRAKMKDPGCHCETKNPSGSCCLGNVGKGIKIAREELGMSDSDAELSLTSAKSSGNKGEKIAKVGTLVSAIMASACCWLPLVFLTVGVSGAGIAAALEEYRPYFMVITFGFLGAAFYFTYRPKKMTEAAGGHDCCAPAKGRFNIIAMNKVMLWGVTVMAVAFLSFPNYIGALLGGDGTVVNEKMNRALVHVEGMTCEGCSALVAEAIRAAPGVLAVEVDYAKGEAIVGTEICCPIPEEEILFALNQAGYSGQIVKDSVRQEDLSKPVPTIDQRSPR